ncbi:MAG: glycosyltransferase family 39 protein, partial [Pseudomonadota bacterium]
MTVTTAEPTLAPAPRPLFRSGVMRFVLSHPRAALLVLCLALFLPGLTTLPPLDRDESRFAQASKQMVEENTYIAIHFQDDYRNKKPVGIHWLQAGSVHLFGSDKHNEIWTYRLPSVLGAILAVWFMFWVGRLMFDPETGLIAAGFLAATVSLIAEANISKTDAVLLATVIAAQGFMIKAYLAARRPELEFGFWSAMGFWLALSVGLLIKGPIQPLVVLLTMGGMLAFGGDRRWLASLRPLRGLALLLVLTLPWGIAVYFATEGTFYREAVGIDLWKKLYRAMEGHWGIPGYYASLINVTFWPGTLFLIPAFVYAIRQRRQTEMTILLSWAILPFLLFEIVVTKLPHYSMPTYPAYALMAAALITGAAREPSGLAAKIASGLAGRIAIGLFVLVGGALSLCVVVLPFFYGPGLVAHLVPFAALATLAVLGTAYIAWRADFLKAAGAALATAVILYIALLEVAAPHLHKIDVSRTMAGLVAKHTDGTAPVASSGYREPSFVFLMGTETRLANPDGAADLLASDPRAVAFIEKRNEPAFLTRAEELNLTLQALHPVEG